MAHQYGFQLNTTIHAAFWIYKPDQTLEPTGRETIVEVNRLQYIESNFPVVSCRTVTGLRNQHHARVGWGTDPNVDSTTARRAEILRTRRWGADDIEVNLTFVAVGDLEHPDDPDLRRYSQLLHQRMR
jgi:hypothetical protein